MYVISPWSRGGWVNSQVFDHTSVLRFLEARFGVRNRTSARSAARSAAT
jgi:phospholipase C